METVKSLLASCVVDYILPEYKKKTKITEFTIQIISWETLKIKYKHHIYHATVKTEDNKYYWELNPYCKSIYTTPIIGTNSFDRVLFAIREDSLTREKKKRP